MSRSVREPIQVYLTERERGELDRLAEELGVSRSETLRRGIRALGGGSAAPVLTDRVDDDVFTPATAGPGEPPPSKPVTTLAEIQAELDADRADR